MKRYLGFLLFLLALFLSVTALSACDFDLGGLFGGETTTAHVTAIDPAIPPTCTQEGLTEGSHCALCGEVFVEQTVTPALHHAYENGSCTRCGEREPSKGLSFASNGDGTCSVIGIGSCTDTELMIPALSPDGDTVTSIGERAFISDTHLTSLIIPNSVTRIGSDAFVACTNLKEVTLGNSVESIGDRAFVGCDSLSLLILNDTLISIGNSAFSWCPSLSELSLPSSVVSIGENAFSYCTGLTFLTILSPSMHIGYLAFYGCQNLAFASVPAYAIPSLPKAGLQRVYITSGTSIDKQAFAFCRNLVSVSIPNTVTTIGEGAFTLCESLTEVFLPSSVTSIEKDAFMSCTGLETVSIGNSVESIDERAFYECCNLRTAFVPTAAIPFLTKESLQEVVITGGTAIAEGAFRGYTNLLSVTIGDSVTSIGERAFANCENLLWVVMSDSVTEIGEFAFSGCKGLTSIKLSSSLASIGRYAFIHCTNLVSVTVPDSVVSIQKNTFDSCDKLQYNEYGTAYYLGNEKNPYAVLFSAKNTLVSTVSIHKDTKTVANGAFENCQSLTSLELPDGLVSISSGAFSHCTSIAYVSAPAHAFTAIPPSFLQTAVITSGTSIPDGTFSSCHNLDRVTIPSTVTSIGKNAFAYCHDLASVTIPSSVRSIGEYAFFYCSSLSSITVPDSVTTIGDSAFSNCTSLTSAVIGEDVTSIGIGAFGGCTSLASVTFKNTAGWEAGGTALAPEDLADTATSALYLRDTYRPKTWTRQ